MTQPTARWRITDDDPFDNIGHSGRFEQGRNITFEVLDNGRRGTFWLPINQYNPETVASMVQARADQILAVGLLGNG